MVNNRAMEKERKQEKMIELKKNMKKKSSFDK